MILKDILEETKIFIEYLNIGVKEDSDKSFIIQKREVLITFHFHSEIEVPFPICSFSLVKFSILTYQ
jgi:hypothetical protein